MILGPFPTLIDCSPVRAELQGHKCILEGPNPGMLIADKGFYTRQRREDSRVQAPARGLGAARGSMRASGQADAGS
jgi:hypothetical protein